MTTTCLINNFNYARYLAQAMDSALGQSTPFDEIIVVDDGSTDGSLELLKAKYSRHPAVQIVAKRNQGQLSCFNEGFARATGDVVFFLDADDVYETDYVARSLNVYDRDRHCDFITCGHRLFGMLEAVQLKSRVDRDLGYSVILTSYLRDWIGGPTSCLSMRRKVLDKILPVPFLDDWRTRADDCLVFGASLAGARKYYLAQPLVRYRVHGGNQFNGRSPDKFEIYRRRLAMNVLFEHFERKLGYDVARLGDFHHREFSTIGRPTLRQFVKYLRVNRASRMSLLRRLACALEMTGHLVRASVSGPSLALDGSLSKVDAATRRPRVFMPASAGAIEPRVQPPLSGRQAA